MALKKLVLDPKYNIQHRLFSKDEGSTMPVRDEPDEARFIMHIRLMMEWVQEKRKEKFLLR